MCSAQRFPNIDPDEVKAYYYELLAEISIHLLELGDTHAGLMLDAIVKSNQRAKKLAGQNATKFRKQR